MDSLLDWFDFGLPWWVWTAPAVAGVVAIFIAVSRVFGVRNAIVAAAVAAAYAVSELSRKRGRQEGWKERIDREKRDAEEIVRRAESARNRAGAADPERLRDDDGFRRD